MQAKKRAKSVKFGKKAESAAGEHALKAHHEDSKSTTAQEANTPINPIQATPPDVISEQNNQPAIEHETPTKAIPAVRIEEKAETNINSDPVPQTTTPPIITKSAQPASSSQTSTAQQETSGGMLSSSPFSTPQPEAAIPQPASSPQTSTAQDTLGGMLSSSPFGNPQTAGAEVSAVGTNQDQVDKNEPEAVDNYLVGKEVKKSWLVYFFLIAVIAFAIGIVSMIVASIYYKDSGFTKNLPFFAIKPTMVPTAIPPSTPSPTPEPEEVLDLKEYGIRILNGSGISGAANRLRTQLENEGFQVVSVGNASRSDHLETIISTNKEIKNIYLEELKSQVGELYKLGADELTPEVASPEADIVITIGRNTTEN